MARSFGANGYKSLPWERHVSIIHAGLKASRTVQNLRAFPRLMTLSVFCGLHNLSDLSRVTSRAYLHAVILCAPNLICTKFIPYTENTLCIYDMTNNRNKFILLAIFSAIFDLFLNVIFIFIYNNIKTIILDTIL